MEIRDQDFVDPPWTTKLDHAAVLRRVPENATVAGLFVSALADEAKRRGTPLPSARDRYVSFQFYPLRELVPILLEACATFHPRRSTRIALRKLGHQAVPSLLASTLGRIVLASKDDVTMVLAGLIKTYPINLRPSSAALLSSSRGRAVVRLEQVHYFLDSHHVGIFEGALRFAGKRETSVRICEHSTTAADLLCSWET